MPISHDGTLVTFLGGRIRCAPREADASLAGMRQALGVACPAKRQALPQ